MKATAISTLFFLIASIASSQSLQMNWEQLYGSDLEEQLNHVCKNEQNDLLLIGMKRDDIGLEGNCYLVKTDRDGNELWNKEFGGTKWDQANYGVKIPEGYLIGGRSSSSDEDVSQNLGSSDIWLMKVDEDANLLWEKSYGGSGIESLNQIVKNSNGYLLVGYTTSSDNDISFNYGSYDGLLMQIDHEGNLLWEKTYGGSDTDLFSSSIQLDNGNYIVLGFTDSEDGLIEQSFGGSDVWVLCVNGQGEIIWDKNIGGSHDDQSYLRPITKTSDGNFVFGVNSSSVDGFFENGSGSNDPWLIKLDNVGNVIWKNEFGYVNGDYFGGIVEGADGSFTIFGSSEIKPSGIGAAFNFWIVNADENGFFQADTIFGQSYRCQGRSILPIDNSWIVAGYTNHIEGDTSANSSDDFWLAEFQNTITSTSSVEENIITIYPNPVNNYLNISDDENQISKIEIVNIHGVIIYSLNHFTSQIDLQNLPNGFYICRLSNQKSELLRSFKFVK